MDKQHVQVPNNMTEKSSLTPDCILVYAGIKKYMNNDTLEAFPSLTTLCKDLDASEPTIRKCIKELVKNEYITVRKEGRKNVYKFSKYKTFEPFSYEFLQNKMCSFMEKAILTAGQQYMYKDPVTHLGKINHSNRKLANLINVSHSTLSRCNKSLQEKGLLQVVTTNAIDPETGCKIQEKIYNLDKLHQGIIFVLKNHEDRITNTENEVEILKKQVESLAKNYNIVLNENRILKEKKSDELIL